jgi:hypothetical protein
MLTLQPQHAFRRSRSASTSRRRMSLPPRPPSRLASQAAVVVHDRPSSSSSGVLHMQPTSPPLFTQSLAAQQELPAVLLHPCLAPEQFLTVWRNPVILATLVQHIQSSRDFLSFIYVSKEMRALVGAAFENDSASRHRFFARFLPGYPPASRPYWNPRLRIDLTDLELLRACSFHPVLQSLIPSRSRIRSGPSL